MRTRKFTLSIITASLLALAVAAPVAAKATVDQFRETLVDQCVEHWDEDPTTGEPYFVEFCVSGTWNLTSVVTPSGVAKYSGSVSSSSAQWYMGEMLLGEDTQTHKFTNLSRNGVEQLLRSSLTMSGTNAITGETYSCYLNVVATNGETRHGSPDLICDNGTGGGGQG